jgi:peptidoglycan-N-acetylglucosamine deacetylase
LATGNQNRDLRLLLPGKTLWLAIAGISCSVFVLLHTIFGGVSAEALIAKTGVGQTVDVATNIIRSIPMNFDVPKKFAARAVKEAIPLNAEKVIALTFDDGPWPKTTESILATLKKENIKATFFMIGQPLLSFPELGKKVLAGGHVIANHTTHHWYHKMSPAVAQKEIDDTSKIIKQVLNVETEYFRPPGGMMTNGLVAYAESKKQSVVMWSIDSNDSHPRRPSAEAMIKTVVGEAAPGGIVLMHDGGGHHENTAKALPQMIAQLRAKGYKFVTVPELFELASAPPSTKINNTASIKPTVPTPVTKTSSSNLVTPAAPPGTGSTLPLIQTAPTPGSSLLNPSATPTVPTSPLGTGKI